MPAYIGRSPVYGSFQKQDFTPNGSTTSFTLDIGVSNSESIILVVSGVVQEPGTGKAYIANGTTLTLSEAPATGETMYVVYLGTQLVTPFGDVTNLSDVTISSIASGEILKWNGSAWINNTLAEAGIAPVASPDFTTAVNLLARGELRFQDAAGGQYVGFEAPATVSSNVMWVLPAADGSNGQMLSTNGSGTLAWATVSSTSLTDADNNTKVQVEESADENKIRFDTAGVERMMIGNTGRVSIGTSSPTQKFVVSNAGADNIVMAENSSASIQMFMQATSGTGSVGTLTNHDTQFLTNNTERMRIATDGKVGIGTSSASQPLHIKHPSGGTYLRLEDGSSSYKYDLGVENGQGNAFVLNDANANAIRMVVKTDGKVGIGTTNPTRQLELKGATENAPLVIDTASGSHAGVWFKENGTDRWQIYSVSSSGDLAYFNYGTSSESMRIKADGKVGIGTSSPSRLLHVKGGAGSNYLRIDNSADGHDVGFELYQNNVRKWEIVSDDSESDALVFRPGGQEKIRIKTDGTLMVNTTSQLTGAPFFEVHGANSIVAIWNSKVAGSSQQQLHSFYRNGQVCGHIHVTGNSVSYATSSDYRLKENVTELVGAIDRIKQFKPYRFNFIEDGPSKVVDGFVAHEVSGIVPEAITGEKDAMYTAEDLPEHGVDDPMFGTPKYQSIDQAKLVPLTIAALQEALAKIETLEAKVAALEAQ